MRRRHTVRTTASALLVVAAVATCLALVAAYQRGYDAEVGNRDDAERVMTGVYVALPWIALLATELLALIVIGLWRAAQTAAGTADDAAEGTSAVENCSASSTTGPPRTSFTSSA